MYACLPCFYLKPFCVANLEGFEIMTSRAVTRPCWREGGWHVFMSHTEFQTFSYVAMLEGIQVIVKILT